MIKSIDRLQKLLSEARGCAVVDAGCSNTVCGSQWLEEFLNTLGE